MKPWDNFTTDQEWKEFLQKLVKVNDKALHRGILAIYQLQTHDEKQSKVTKEHNGIGFGSVDAKFMSDLAEILKKGGQLSDKQKAIARNKLAKYWRQLMLISKGELTVEILPNV